MNPIQRASRAQQHWHSGQLAAQAQMWAGAAMEFERAAALTPGDAVVWLNLARAWHKLLRLPDATRAAERAFELQRGSAPACRVLAECLSQQHRFDEAVAAFEALAPDAPRDHDLLAAHGNALFQAKRPQEAIEAFFQALALKLDNALTHYQMGLAFMDLKMSREASECFRTAVSIDKGNVRAMALALLVHESRQACEWEHAAADTAALLAALDDTNDAGGELLSPFAVLAIDSTPAQQRRIGWLRAQALTRHIKPLPAPGPRKPGRIRVGYLSADFYQHATSVLMAELLERRDSERFEVFLYSHSPEDGSAIQKRVRAACDQWLDVTHMSNTDVARRMRDDGLDIAIDLKGYTRDSRFELLAARPAPVQVAYLGYPATTGAEFIDYMLGDPVVLPLDHAAQYSEKLAQMPASYQPNDRQRSLSAQPARSAVGLPNDAVVLCCFNQTYKVSPAMVDLWTRILNEAPNTVLWMLAWNAHAEANLLRELATRGIARGRVLFAPKLSMVDHLARMRCADLFLDTWPCNAHTTASEALWCGVPVLTVPGPTFASRVAASLVNACGLPDLACADADAYVQMAVALAGEPDLLQGLKAHLDIHRMQLPLFDSDRYARDFEALLLRMFERQEAGLPPDHLPALAGT